MDLTDINKWYDFSGRSAVVTGGTGVLGGEIVRALVGCGANVAVLNRRPELAERKVERFDTGNGEALYVYGDVLQPDLLQEAAQQVRQAFGRIDILVNAAGGNHPKATTSADLSFFDLPPEALQFVFELNTIGTILPCQAFGRSMMEQGEGVILNVSSMSAFSPLTRVSAYSAAKAGLNNFTRWLAVHMAQEYSANIRVNAIAPGFFLTKQNRFLLLEKDSNELTSRGQSIVSHTPMGRFGDPQDIVGTVLWLLSPGAAFVTGVVVPIDGGFSAFSGV